MDLSKPRCLTLYWSMDFLSQPKLLSRELLDLVSSHFNLKEKEYFGFTYVDDMWVPLVIINAKMKMMSLITHCSNSIDYFYDTYICWSISTF